MAPSPSLTGCAGYCAPNCQGRSITSAQEPKAPNAVPAAVRIAFISVRPLRVRVHNPSSSSVPSSGNSSVAKDAFRGHWQTVLLTHPPGSRRGRSSVRRAAKLMAMSRFFWKTAGGAFPGPAASCRPSAAQIGSHFGTGSHRGSLRCHAGQPPADAPLMEKIPYWAIGFFIGSVPVAVVVAWLLKKLGL